VLIGTVLALSLSSYKKSTSKQPLAGFFSLFAGNAGFVHIRSGSLW
jgi:hypothetical protein